MTANTHARAAAVLAARSVECVPANGLAGRLANPGPLRVKFGVDPTSPDIHLGHTVVLGKLREFQDAGHTAVLIIGDWTARVGDPSERASTRPVLRTDEVERNAETYRAQAFAILDAARTEIRENGEWFAGMGLEEIFALTSRATVNQLLRRNDFATRIDADQPISLLELLYPLMQGYDSVAVRADVELGGTDQLFNLMMGRVLQEAYGQAPQVVMTMPILPGTDGVRRMGKSLGNAIGVTERPEEQFGKIMSVPDAALDEYFALLAPGSPRGDGEPAVDAKRRLGRIIADRFHGPGAGDAAEEHFNRTVRDRSAPDAIRVVQIPAGPIHLPALLVGEFGIASRSAARRLIAQHGVLLDGTPTDRLDVDATDLDGRLIRVGKRTYAALAIRPTSPPELA